MVQWGLPTHEEMCEKCAGKKSVFPLSVVTARNHREASYPEFECIELYPEPATMWCLVPKTHKRKSPWFILLVVE